MGLCSTARGIGCIIGPIIGQYICARYDLEVTFYVFAGLNFISGFIMLIVVPSYLNKDEKSEIKSLSQIQAYDISYFRILNNYRVCWAVLTGTITLMFTFFFDATLSKHL